MPSISKSVTVNRSPAEVIEYIADVSNHPAFIGPLNSVADLSGDPRKPETSWTWVFVMAGVEISGSAETVKYEPSRLFSYRTTSGALSTFEYTAEAQRDATTVTINVTYEIPETLLGKMQAPVIEKLNDSDGQRAVDNLKVILDA
ncbi:MAG: SRPBCC family protein [Gemmatimonadota bacterium]|nr:SRPBCC family protein [Gemmatimonadota bacterium]